MLEVHDLTRKFGRRTAVDGVSFQISSGEIVGYPGPNGAGKSTTVKMLVGMLPPTRGEILIDGEPVEKNLVRYKMRVGDVWRFLIFLAAACFGLAKLNRQRVRALKRGILRFEESPGDSMTILSLQ